MAYVIDGLAGVDLTKTDSTARYTLGTVVRTNIGEFTYVKHALAAAAAGDWYKIQEDFVTVALDTTESGSEPTLCGVPQVAIAAGTSTAQYAWVFTGYGNFQGSVATTISAGAALTTTASAKVAGAGGDAVGAAAVGNTSGGAAVITCFAPARLYTN